MDQVQHRLRRRARDLYYRRRYMALTSDDQVRASKLRKTILVITSRIVAVNDGPERCRLQRILKILTSYHLSIVLEPDYVLERPLRLHRSVDSFSESDCSEFLRFHKCDLRLLIELLRFDDSIKLDNRSCMTGEEVFLRGLYELSSGEKQHSVSTNVFGREASSQSRAFTWFVNHIYTTFRHLVMDNLLWWKRNGFFATSANAISAKMGLQCVVAHFIDCNCLPTSVVGGGPAEGGANAIRWDDTIQRAFFNGWKSLHGLKHQTVNNAYGFTVDIYGPTSLRRNDMALLRLSDINNRMAALQEGDATQYITFGDSAYRQQSHIASYVANDEGLENYRQFNAAIKRVRISIEWDYGCTAALFPYLQNKRKLQLLQGQLVSKIYIVATLFRNFHTALYGCQTSNYFDLAVPNNFLTNYINQTNF